MNLPKTTNRLSLIVAEKITTMTYFIIDNIKSKYTDSIDVLLLSPTPPSPVITFGYPRKTVAHWVDDS